MRRIDVLELRDGPRSSAGGLARGATLNGYERLARSVGLDPICMLDATGLPGKALSDPDTLISVDAVAALLEESARRSNQEAFGPPLAEMQRLSHLGVLAAVLREEPTLRAALEAVGRYMCLQNAGLRLTPVLVLASLWVGPAPMDLVFPGGLMATVLLSVLVTGQVAGDGRSDWLRGELLLAVYLIFGLAFFFVPGAPVH
jgi:hypothetical protein